MNKTQYVSISDEGTFESTPESIDHLSNLPLIESRCKRIGSVIPCDIVRANNKATDFICEWNDGTGFGILWSSFEKNESCLRDYFANPEFVKVVKERFGNKK